MTISGRDTDASHSCERQDLLHRDARHRHCAIGRLLQDGLRLNIRQRGDGRAAFDDTTGQVSGTWVLGRSPSPGPGLLIYVMVDSVAATLAVIVANGGEVVQPIGADAPEITAPRPGRKWDRPLRATGLTEHDSARRRSWLRTHTAGQPSDANSDSLREIWGISAARAFDNTGGSCSSGSCRARRFAECGSGPL
jgi:hypothetical protein